MQDDWTHNSIWDEVTPDPATAPLGAFTRAISEIHTSADQTHGIMEIETVKLDLPVELDVHVNGEGKVALATTPPHLEIETGFNTPLHRIKMTITETNGQHNQ